MIFYFVSAAILIASFILCRLIAKRRGASPVFWGAMGAFFGPFAIPFAFFSKPKAN